MSFDRRCCGRETRWREQKRKTGGSRKRKGFPLHRPMVDSRPVPGTPRKGANAMWTTKAEEDEVATVGLQMWLHGPGIPFWEMFPPLEIDKPPRADINYT